MIVILIYGSRELSISIRFYSRLVGPDDLVDVMDYVHNLNQSALKKLGLQLGLLDSTLDKLLDQTRPEEYGMKVMSAWLNQRDNVAKRGKPTWTTLATALKHRTVDCNLQGDQILTDLREGTLPKD